MCNVSIYRVVINIIVNYQLSIIKLQAQTTKEKKSTHEISTDVTMHAMRCDEVHVKCD